MTSDLYNVSFFFVHMYCMLHVLSKMTNYNKPHPLNADAHCLLLIQQADSQVNNGCFTFLNMLVPVKSI